MLLAEEFSVVEVTAGNGSTYYEIHEKRDGKIAEVAGSYKLFANMATLVPDYMECLVVAEAVMDSVSREQKIEGELLKAVHRSKFQMRDILDKVAGFSVAGQAHNGRARCRHSATQV